MEKFAIVTGGSSGIGLATVNKLIERGIRVATLERKPNPAVPDSDMRRHFDCDITDSAAVYAAVDAAIEWGGAINYLFNIAGVSLNEGFLETPEEHWDKVINLNLKAPFIIAQYVAKKMIEMGGGESITLTSSNSAFGATPKLGPHYHASKAGIVNLARLIGVELAPYGIRCNSVAPGLIKTPMTEHLMDTPEKMHMMFDRRPISRPGEPDEIAAAMVFMGVDATFCTADNLLVDGGIVAVV